MKTFFLAKEDDDIERLVERMGREEDDITLVIPKGAQVRGSRAFFKHLEQYARTAEKKILIESIDEETLRTARAADLEATHPLFGDSKKISDVESQLTARIEEPRGKKSKTRHLAREVESPQLAEEKEKHRRVRVPWKAILMVCVIGGVAIGLYTVVWSNAEILIRFEKKPFSYSAVFLVDAAATESSAEKRVLPGQAFTSEKNLTQLFPASGSKQVSEKATGVLTIYNAFSSDPQVLVASTRFETPEGKIFRLTQQVRVPGAEVKEGNITPSKIQTTVVADAPGEEYTLAPVSRLTLPGFKGTAKYEKFYGSLEEGTKGGFKGLRPVPTSADLERGKEQLTAILKNVLESSFLLGYPPDVSILPGASELTVVRLSANESTDGQGNFSVFGEAQVKAIGFREKDLKRILSEIGSERKDSGLTLEPLEIGYGDVKADFKTGTLSIGVSATGTLTTSFDGEAFKKIIEGRTPDQVKTLVSKLTGFEGATVSLRPVWLRHIPQDMSRIRVVVE